MLVPGLPPLSVTLMGMFKSDVRLLAVAAKLAPLIATAAREQVQDVNRISRIQVSAGLSSRALLVHYGFGLFLALMLNDHDLVLPGARPQEDIICLCSPI